MDSLDGNEGDRIGSFEGERSFRDKLETVMHGENCHEKMWTDKKI